MTTTFFAVLLFIGSIVLFIGCALSLSTILDSENAVIACAFIITIIFAVGYCIFTPSMVQMIENDYYAMMEDRPKCIDAGDVSLGCKKDYIDWQKDSIEKQLKYDSVKVKLENLMIKADTIRVLVVKNDTHESDSVKACIDQCWKLGGMNSDIKMCQDECFK